MSSNVGRRSVKKHPPGCQPCLVSDQDQDWTMHCRHGGCQEQHPAVVSASPQWGRSPQTRYGQAEKHIETFSAMLWTIFLGEGWDAAVCEPCSAITLLPRTCSGAGGQEAKFLKHVSSKAEGLLNCYPASGTGYTTSTVKINVGKVPHSQLCCCFEKNHDPGSTLVK